jgi:hypothetical protein
MYSCIDIVNIGICQMWHAWFTSHHGRCGQVSAPMDIDKYREWLWAATGESDTGFGQVPGILILVDAVLEGRSTA